MPAGSARYPMRKGTGPASSALRTMTTAPKRTTSLSTARSAKAVCTPRRARNAAPSLVNAQRFAVATTAPMATPCPAVRPTSKIAPVVKRAPIAATAKMGRPSSIPAGGTETWPDRFSPLPSEPSSATTITLGGPPWLAAGKVGGIRGGGRGPTAPSPAPIEWPAGSSVPAAGARGWVSSSCGSGFVAAAVISASRSPLPLIFRFRLLAHLHGGSIEGPETGDHSQAKTDHRQPAIGSELGVDPPPGEKSEENG